MRLLTGPRGGGAEQKGKGSTAGVSVTPAHDLRPGWADTISQSCVFFVLFFLACAHVCVVSGLALPPIYWLFDSRTR